MDVSIAIYALTFKPDIDDLRESPALAIASRLYAEHLRQLLVVEDYRSSLPAALLEAGLRRSSSAFQADIHVMLIYHRAFRELLRQVSVLLDTRAVWGSA